MLLVCLFLGASPAHAQSAKGPGLADLSRSLQELAGKVSPSVVQIFVVGFAAPDADETTATGDPVLERGSGSGVIVAEDGYIVTNAHVVENATRIEVELPFAATGGNPGRSIIGRRGRTLGAQIVAVDEETDLAVLKIDARGLPVMPYGDSDWATASGRPTTALPDSVGPIGPVGDAVREVAGGGAGGVHRGARPGRPGGPPRGRRRGSRAGRRSWNPSRRRSWSSRRCCRRARAPSGGRAGRSGRSAAGS